MHVYYILINDLIIASEFNLDNIILDTQLEMEELHDLASNVVSRMKNCRCRQACSLARLSMRSCPAAVRQSPGWPARVHF